MESDLQEASFLEELSDDEDDWEEVAVQPVDATNTEGAPVLASYEPYAGFVAAESSIPAPRENIEITLGARKGDEGTRCVNDYGLMLSKGIEILVRQKGISHAERLIRIDCHKTHTVCLLASACVRNRWLNDDLLHVSLFTI
jgi:hypothetical protein